MKIKRSLIEYGIIIVVFGGLYITGLHTEVLGFVQRAVLATGIHNPEVEGSQKEADNYLEANYSMVLIDQDGNKLAMDSLRGKVVFLNIWASWCPPCLAEMPGIDQLYQEMEAQDVAFIMLSVDEDFKKAIKFRKRKGYDFDIYQAPAGLPSTYYTQSIPTTFVINAEGKLVLKHEGMGDFDTKEFKGFLKSLTAKETY